MKESRLIPQASNIETIINSIKYDPQVYHWFSSLIMRPKIKNELTDDDPTLARSFHVSGTTRLLYYLFSAFVFTFLWLFANTKNYVYLICVLLFLILCIGCVRKNKKIIILLSRKLLTKTYPGNTISSKTLYQVAEIYSRIYGIPSMIDVIYHWDHILQKTMMAYALIIIAKINNLSLLEFAGYFFITWFTANITIRLMTFYRKLR
ncbi:MAG: hypothetical protein KAS66_14015 [Candidatus Omnitrophica bacterium]|nr:hypothetical protein [Candidatus Omnitrophota bacterium]